MLCELRVKNLALIETLELSFEENRSGELVVMTGETGAGKSIMLRALGLLSGRRASVDWIRNGAQHCEVEALFEINPDHHRLLQNMADRGHGEEPSLVIRRVLNCSGRSKYYINGSLATAREVADYAGELINIASQHDQQLLLQSSLHLDFLDTVGDLWPLRQEVSRLFDAWQKTKAELNRLKQEEQEKEQRQDFLRFQVAEIQEASLQEGEDEQLLAEKKRLKNGQALIKLSQASHVLLSGKLLEELAQLRQNLSQIASLDENAVKLSEDISGYTFLAEDYLGELRRYRDSLENDPYRLEQANERLDTIQKLKRKYGETIADVLMFAESSAGELAQLENLERLVGELEQKVAAQEKKMCERSEVLSAKREEIALFFEKAMEGQLASLAFDSPRFLMAWSDIEKVAENMKNSGWDRGEFLFSANRGETPRPLAKIASGGELSRLLLAMKCLLAQKDMVETVIFDEVDAGIGGEAAEAVARKIQELSNHHQVFCITHLPQIAARGTSHFQVVKSSDGERTRTKVTKLGAESRIHELGRMLAGTSVSSQTRAWAEELLAKGKACV